MSIGAVRKNAVVSLVERGGTVRSFHPAVAAKEAVVQIVKGAEGRGLTYRRTNEVGQHVHG